MFEKQIITENVHFALSSRKGNIEREVNKKIRNTHLQH